MKIDKSQIEEWQTQARVAYGTKAYQECFELYWEITSGLRVGKTPEFWEQARIVKLAVWEEEGQ